MRIYNDEIQIMRGETWNFDVQLTAYSGAPFILSNQLKNPYFLLTISSLKYPVEDRIVRNYWCKCTSGIIPRRFFTTAVVPVSNTFIKTYENAEAFSTAIKSVTNLTQIDESELENAAVYSTIVDDTVNYWMFEKDGEAYKPVKYECRFTVNFQSFDTSEWIEEEYSFAMKLVDFVADKVVKDNYSPFEDRLDRLGLYQFVQEFDVPKMIKVHSNIYSSLI